MYINQNILFCGKPWIKASYKQELKAFHKTRRTTGTEEKKL